MRYTYIDVLLTYLISLLMHPPKEKGNV